MFEAMFLGFDFVFVGVFILFLHYYVFDSSYFFLIVFYLTVTGCFKMIECFEESNHSIIICFLHHFGVAPCDFKSRLLSQLSSIGTCYVNFQSGLCIVSRKMGT